MDPNELPKPENAPDAPTAGRWILLLALIGPLGIIVLLILGLLTPGVFRN